MNRYEIIPHTADIGIKVCGEDLTKLFDNAAYGMFDIIADLDGLKSSVEIPVKASGQNREELLIAWLSELLYHFYTKQIIFFEFHIEELDDMHIIAKAVGRHVGSNRNRLKTEIKAVTYHELKIEETEGKLNATLIFDV